MNSELENQELSDERIKELIKKHNLSQRKLAKIHRRKVCQINFAINTSDYPGLRKRIIEGLLRRESQTSI